MHIIETIYVDYYNIRNFGNHFKYNLAD